MQRAHSKCKQLQNAIKNTTSDKRDERNAPEMAAEAAAGCCHSAPAALHLRQAPMLLQLLCCLYGEGDEQLEIDDRSKEQHG
jgi:hypothetical protein